MATEDLRGMVAAEVAASTKRLATIIGNTPTVVFTVWLSVQAGHEEAWIVAPKVTADIKAVPHMVISMLYMLEAGRHLGRHEVEDTYIRAGDEWAQRVNTAEPGTEVLVRVPITDGKGFVVMSRQPLLTRRDLDPLPHKR